MRPPISLLPHPSSSSLVFASPLLSLALALAATTLPVLVSAQENQDNGNIYVLVNDTAQWVAQPPSSWTLNTTLGNYASSWLIGHRAEDGTPTTATVTFNGTDFWIFGTVANGIQNASLNYTVKVDNNETTTEPSYIPSNLANGMDVSWTLFSQRSLPLTTHTVTLTLIGETSPFYIQGALVAKNTAVVSTSSAAPSSSSSAASSAATNSSSDDSVKLGGAIGGGVGALLIVALIILFMIRRIRRVEAKEREVMARPFVAGQRRTPGAAGSTDPSTLAHGPRTGTTTSSQRSRTLFPGSIRSEKEKDKEKLVQPHAAAAPSAPSSSKSRSRTYSSSKSQSHSRNPSQSHSQTHIPLQHAQPLVRVPSVPRQDVLASPPGSIISLPSEFQAATTVVGGGRGPGTAVASSYIGTTPPDEDAPPVPALPRGADLDAMMMGKKKTKTRQDTIPTDLPPPFESIHPQTTEYPPDLKRDSFRASSLATTTPLNPPKRTPDSTYFSSSSFPRSNSIPLSSSASGIGLFSTDSVNTIGSTTSTGLSRPLPTVPGTRGAVPIYSFPPEKVGLSPPPPAHQQRARSNSTKRPLPQPDTPSAS